MAHWRKTKRPSVYVAHQLRCPARDDDARCRCEPSWRGRRRHPVTGKAEWQKPVTKDRDEVLSWLGVGKKGAHHARERARSDRTFASIGDEWLDGARAGRISRRKGRSKPYSPTTIADCTRAYRNFLRPAFGPMPADEIDALEGRMWCDRLSREGLSPLRLVELSPNDERPRLRVAFASEAERLLAALEPEDAVPRLDLGYGSQVHP